jgi:hypothetical protein
LVADLSATTLRAGIDLRSGRSDACDPEQEHGDNESDAAHVLLPNHIRNATVMHGSSGFDHMTTSEI